MGGGHWSNCGTSLFPVVSVALHMALTNFRIWYNCWTWREVCTSVGMFHLWNYYTDFNKIWYWRWGRSIPCD